MYTAIDRESVTTEAQQPSAAPPPAVSRTWLDRLVAPVRYAWPALAAYAARPGGRRGHALVWVRDHPGRLRRSGWPAGTPATTSPSRARGTTPAAAARRAQHPRVLPALSPADRRGPARLAVRHAGHRDRYRLARLARRGLGHLRGRRARRRAAGRHHARRAVGGRTARDRREHALHGGPVHRVRRLVPVGGAEEPLADGRRNVRAGRAHPAHRDGADPGGVPGRPGRDRQAAQQLAAVRGVGDRAARLAGLHQVGRRPHRAARRLVPHPGRAVEDVVRRRRVDRPGRVGDSSPASPRSS